MSSHHFRDLPGKLDYGFGRPWVGGSYRSRCIYWKEEGYCFIYPLRIHGTNGYERYIYLHEWLIRCGFHVGKYTSPMDPI